MSESAEKKVLKEMLVKLKAKTIMSQILFTGVSLSMSQSTNSAIRSALGGVMKMADGEVKKNALLLLAVFQSWNQNLNLLNSSIVNLTGDMNLYIEALEKYSTELDNTLTSIFQQAKEMVEKQQEERKKRIDYGV